MALTFPRFLNIAPQRMPDNGHYSSESTEFSYTIVRSKRRRRTIGLTIESVGSVRISAPMRASDDAIESVIRRRLPWITSKFAQIKALPSFDTRFKDGGYIYYFGYPCRLVIRQNSEIEQGCLLTPHALMVNMQDGWLNGDSLRDEARLEVILWMKKRARIKLQKRLDLYARKLDLSYRRFDLTDADYRWGSCSARNVIRLNWRLVMTPLPLIDYVVAHELCHIIYKDHSRRFWQLLGTVMPDCAQRRKALRAFEKYCKF